VGVVHVQPDWQRLVSVLLGAFGAEVARRRRPTWFFVAPEGNAEREDAFALGFSDRPDALDGIAPPEWQAVGVVGIGRGFLLDGGHGCTTASVNGAGEPLRVACLVTRKGNAYCKAMLPGGQVIEDPPTAGLLLNELRSCFGLPPLPPLLVPRKGKLARRAR
jgi:catechol 2,3-dioxygenase-like lactoylglutathione lyase family enzyme